MLAFLLFFLVLLWLIGNHLHQKEVQRTNRLLRRVPCVSCGCPLLPAARSCPHCRCLQPLRGWARIRERWQPQPAPSTNLIIHAAPRSEFRWIVAALVIAYFVVVFALYMAARHNAI